MKRLTCTGLVCCLAGAALIGTPGRAETPAPAVATPVALETALPLSLPPPGAFPLSLRNELRAATARSLDWLVAQQQAAGCWSKSNYPALTALALEALLQADRPGDRAAVDRAVAFILGCTRPDGGIFVDVQGVKGGGLSNYNTAICMNALHKTRNTSLLPVIQRARAFIAGAQHFGDDEYRGGFGYDRNTKRAYTDLLNTYHAAVAMRETQGVEDLRPAGEPKVDIDWSATVAFVARQQNQAAAGPEHAGGFVYNPTDPKAGATTNADGVVVFRSYGSMTYAGMLALIYADVGRDDVRVKAALDWAERHWTLKENPGMGQEGLYFFYSVLGKCLSANGRDLLKTPDGTLVDWRVELARELIARQRIDPATGHGYWVNDNGRYWENDPILVTAYALLALQTIP